MTEKISFYLAGNMLVDVTIDLEDDGIFEVETLEYQGVDLSDMLEIENLKDIIEKKIITIREEAGEDQLVNYENFIEREKENWNK